MMHINPSLAYVIPTRDQVASLKVGDLALDCFGKMSRVTRIVCCKEDIHGKLFVIYYTQLGTTSSISGSYKEGELVRTVQLSNEHTSSELCAIERELAKVVG